jgi:hypothetical protein
MPEAKLCAWLGEALPGTVLKYHRGFLSLDVDPHSGRMSDCDRAELRLVAKRARWAFEQGLVHLVQRRHGTHDYSYMLIMRPRSRAAPLPASAFEGDASDHDECLVVTASAEVEI